MGRGRLMENQKQSTLELVATHRDQGRTIGEVLSSLGVARSNYYRWKKSAQGEKSTSRPSSYEITAEERKWIDEVKEQHPQYRHRRIQGVLQQRGVYLSASVIYGHLKVQGQIEPYARRAAPWKSPRYEVWQRNLIWGSDWTKLSVGGVRWYLLTVIDFFSRWIIAWEVVPTVHAGNVKAIYQAGLRNQGISIHSENPPKLRVDRGSPNTSGITQEFFESLGADLSFARVRRPTDNALTERFYGSIKQEEIYLVGNYPDQISAKEEIGRYIERYHNSRPHQSLMNFTPAHAHQVNNKSQLLAELKEMKQITRDKRKAYWMLKRNPDSTPSAGGSSDIGPAPSVNPGANTEVVFQHQPSDSQTESPSTDNYSLVESILSH
jgi:transposase InsO family protein